MTGPLYRWVTQAHEPLGALLDRVQARDALAEGRVFLNGKRVGDPEGALIPGMTVELYAPREGDSDVRLIAVEQGLAFVAKPVGIATEPERRGASTSLVHRVAVLLGIAPESVHALSRLDVGVSGVVMLGLSAEARQRTQAYREQGLLRRRYLAIAAGIPAPEHGSWSDPIGKMGRGPRRAVRIEGAAASTQYRVAASLAPEGARPSASVLLLDPLTGRTHQLRVHAAAHAAPLFGDRTYGGPARVVSHSGAVLALDRVYLHAAWVQVPNLPRMQVALPEAFAALWRELGGESSALHAALDAAALP